MANTIPCPNPTCTHEFRQAELQAASSVQCPRCGFRMQGKGPAQAPAPAKPAAPPSAKPVASAKPAAPAKPSAPSPTSPPVTPALKAVITNPAKPATPSKKPAPPPQAKPIAPPQAKPIAPPQAKPSTPPAAILTAPPVAKPVTPTPPGAGPPDVDVELDVDVDVDVDVEPVSPQQSGAGEDAYHPQLAVGGGRLVHSRPTKKKFNWARLSIIVCSIGFAMSVVIVAIYAVITLLLGSGGLRELANQEGTIYNGTIRNQKEMNEKIYRLVLPRQDWSVENEIQSKFGAHAAWKHNDQDFWFAIVVKDYNMLKPRDAEMLRLAIDKLENYYGDALELDAKAVPGKVGDLPAQKLRFKGQIKAANWIGECYMFFKNGVAYWFYLASPDWEVEQFFATELPEKNFTVVSERSGWREQAPPVESFTSENGKIAVTAPKGVWEKHNAKNEDEKGELFLFGRYQKDKEKDNRKNATMLLFLMDKKDDPKDAIKAAREYLENKTKADNANFKIMHATDVAEGQSAFGTIEDVGNRRGRVMDLKLQFNEEPKRYLLLSVVNDPDLCYVIVCDCTWESRQIWRQDFLDLLRTMRIKKSE